MEAPKTFSQSDVIRILKNTGNIKILEQPAIEFSTETDYSGFESEYPKQTPHIKDELEETAEACRGFLAGVVITDDFKDHSQRREWRHEMFAKYGSAFANLYDTNKLRLNNIASLHLWFTTLRKAMDVFKVRSDKADAVKRIASEFPDLKDYNESMSVEERLEFVRKVDAVCISFLKILSTPSTAPAKR